jgi:hypothetical protein
MKTARIQLGDELEQHSVRLKKNEAPRRRLKPTKHLQAGGGPQ